MESVNRSKAILFRRLQKENAFWSYDPTSVSLKNGSCLNWSVSGNIFTALQPKYIVSAGDIEHFLVDEIRKMNEKELNFESLNF